MYKNNRWDMYFREQDCPCFVTEVGTQALLYCNNKFLTEFKIKCDSSEILGKNINDITELNNIELLTTSTQIKDIEYWESETVDTITNTKYNIKNILSTDKTCLITKLLIVDSITEYMYEKAMADCLDILQMPYEFIIPELLKILNKFYKADSSFVYKLDYQNKIIQCDLDLSNDNELEISVADKILEHTNTIFEWLDLRDDIGIIESSITRENIDPLSKQILELFEMKNITIYVVEDDGVPFAIIGLNEREETFLDFRLLKSVAKFVGNNILSEANIEESIIRLKNIDELTGFYNRINYSKKVDIINDNPPPSLGIISVNINGLKYINEQLGYLGGDKHIKLASEKLKDYFDNDFYRISGDEFIGIVENADEMEFEDKVLRFLSKMKLNKDYNFALGFSFAKGSFNFNKLVTESEIVLYINKQDYYSNSEHKFDTVEDNTLSNLLKFLENDEFIIYLQPQVNLKDGSLYGAEALIRRFDRVKRKMVFPDQFIQKYEDKSIIRHIDMFVTENICQLLSKWNSMDKAIPISINLSRVTLQEFGIVENIVEICSRHNVPHHLLVIEVTERVGAGENNISSNLINSFKEQGFNVSLDDFGCAYSNIVTLAEIEVDEVKIDKSLVTNLTSNKKNHILVKNILAMCSELDDTSTLAEGIECEQQAKLLYDLGCHLGQGYYYSRPIPILEFEKRYIYI